MYHILGNSLSKWHFSTICLKFKDELINWQKTQDWNESSVAVLVHHLLRNKITLLSQISRSFPLAAEHQSVCALCVCCVGLKHLVPSVSVVCILLHKYWWCGGLTLSCVDWCRRLSIPHCRRLGPSRQSRSAMVLLLRKISKYHETQRGTWV